jgi:transaldolase
MSNAHELFSKFGQSLWLDCFDRSLVDNGGLRILIMDGVRGVISNPDCYSKTVRETDVYDDAIRDFLQADDAIGGEPLYQWLMTKDARMSADVLKSVYDNSEAQDGFVCVELPANVAYNTEHTLNAARHWWKMVDRKNLMINLPATEQGLLALEILVAEGINVNVTHVFTMEDYRAVIQSYLRGLATNPEPEHVRSVASFWLNTLDAKVNQALDNLGIAEVQVLNNQAAVATAKIAYQYYKQVMDSNEYQSQRQRGASLQRPLWVNDMEATVIARESAREDIKSIYMEQLVGSGTVAALSPEEFDAFLLNGQLLHSLDDDIEAAQRIIQVLDSLEVNLPALAPVLREQCLQRLADSQQALFKALDGKRAQLAKEYA